MFNESGIYLHLLFNEKNIYCEEFEQVVLGLLIIDSEIRNYYISDYTKDSFNNKHHQIIFSIIEQLHNENEEIDLLDIIFKLDDNDRLKEIGGSDYIVSIMDISTK